MVERIIDAYQPGTIERPPLTNDEGQCLDKAGVPLKEGDIVYALYTPLNRYYAYPTSTQKRAKRGRPSLEKGRITKLYPKKVDCYFIDHDVTIRINRDRVIKWESKDE